MPSSLALLLGATPGDMDHLLRSRGVIPHPPGDLAVGVPGDLLRRRPDVRAAERALAAATARIGEAEVRATQQHNRDAGNTGRCLVRLNALDRRRRIVGELRGWRAWRG